MARTLIERLESNESLIADAATEIQEYAKLLDEARGRIQELEYELADVKKERNELTQQLNREME